MMLMYGTILHSYKSMIGLGNPAGESVRGLVVLIMISRRELIRKRQEKSGGKKARTWQIGDACRAVFSEDGEEYEGTVVFKNTANRSVTVRFHGYNNE